MAHRDSPQSVPLPEQVQQQMGIGIEFPLDKNYPEPEITPSPVAPDEKNDNFLGLDYRVDIEVLNN